MPMAPWAKLKMPVVEYVSTRPLAATARMAAEARPVIESCRNWSMAAGQGSGRRPGPPVVGGQLDHVGGVAVLYALVGGGQRLVVREPVGRRPVGQAALGGDQVAGRLGRVQAAGGP